MVRIIGGFKGAAYGVGRHGGFIPAVSGESGEDVRPDKGGVRSDCFLLESQSLRPRADAMSGSLPRSQRGDAEIRTYPEEPEGDLYVGGRRPLHGGIRR